MDSFEECAVARRNVLLVRCIVGPLSLLLLSRFYVCDSTLHYVNNISSSETADDYLRRLRRAKPSISVLVRCFHYEIHKNKDGKTRKTCVTTFEKTFPIRLLSWTDVTEHMDEGALNEYRLTKIKLKMCFAVDEAYEDAKRSLHFANKHRDTHIELIDKMEIPEFKGHVLAVVGDMRKKPMMLNKYISCASLCLPCATLRCLGMQHHRNS